MSYVFTDYNQMVGKRPRQAYWKELQDAINDIQSKSSNNIIDYKLATTPITQYPTGITSYQVTEDVNTGYPSLDGIVETICIDEFRNIQHFFTFTGVSAGSVYYRQWNPSDNNWTPWVKVLTSADADNHFNNTDIHVSPVDRERLEGITFYQPAVSKTWTIDHDLNKFPNVTIVDSGGNVVVGDVQYVSSSRIVVTFTTAFSGIAYLN